MEVHPFEDVAAFAGAASGFLESDPFSTSVIAVQVDSVIAGLRPQGPEDRWWTVVDGGEVVGVAMHTPPLGLFLARMPARAAVALASSLSDDGRDPRGVNGELTAVRSFAGAWEQRTGQTSAVAVSMRMYRLAGLTRPEGVPGRGRLADAPDVGLLAGWVEAFHDEAQSHGPDDDWEALAERRVKAGQFYVWEHHDHVVSSAAVSAPAAGVSRVGPVYTPPVERKRGYASAVTALASSAALEQGGARHVALYTDLSNPTSNAIYQAIGYRPDHDGEERTFRR